MDSVGKVNLKEVKELIRVLDESDVAELTVESDGVRICIRKAAALAAAASAAASASSAASGAAALPVQLPPQAAGAASPQPAAEGAAVAGAASPPAAPTPAAAAGPAAPGSGGDDRTVVVRAPRVGTFYRAPAPDAPPYVEVGQVVEPGQTLCIIEAMKLMNEIEAEVRGRVTAILVENGQPVEYGQPLFTLERL